MTPVRLAVIGCGRQCTRALMPGLAGIDELELVAVCDRVEELARRNARRFGGVPYTDADRMLAAERPDAVMVVGPPEMHEQVGLRVLAAGRHLFVEKPASPTTAGARRLLEACRQAGVVGQVGHMMRHAESVRLAWELSHRPDFGAILSVESKYTTWPTGAMGEGAGWGRPDEDWTYMLVQGGHPIDLLRHWIGPLTAVCARRVHGAGANKVYQVVAEGAGGPIGFLNLQDCYNGWSTKLEITGDGGRVITVEDLGDLRYRRGDAELRAPDARMGQTAGTWEPHFTVASGERAGYRNQLQAFARAILDGTPAYPSLHDAWRNLVVAEAILASCRVGGRVEVPASDLQ